ncbi:type II secretion system F family protein [Sinomonas sp. ASV322]|uniref:type II secretion system F family protein n=1 Tax=Sinomonas sp. ASV322 TaxID=3041920 RepID=UPI0027DB7AD6|nr:type II secretion system F family protein [Sinomonas sp. ASV322]MDQ4501865.1 type II secretion system F family protein [Sinomonas sp. ASV322]
MEVMIGSGLIVVAGIAAAILALRPGHRALPLSRRRLETPDGDSALGRAATGASDALQGWLAGRKLSIVSPESLELAGLRLRQADIVLLVAAGAVLCIAFGWLSGNLVLGILLAALTPVIPRVVVSGRIARRRKRFNDQLADTLHLLAGGLRAGHSVLRAIDAAAAESPQPTAHEMRRVVHETSLGRDLQASLEDAARHMESQDFLWVAQAIQINREVGGNLADVLDQVNETIRERAEIKGHIAALAAEGKFSAYILMALPFGIVLLLMSVNPGYMNVMFTHSLGWVLIGVSVVLMAIGALWLRKIVTIKF